MADDHCGPSITAVLIYSAVTYPSAIGTLHHMSDRSLRITFWTGSLIMFLAFLLAVYFSRQHAREYSEAEVAEAA
jgi:heme/copper-type cytochrome/quinol oxidase subunit 3